MPIKTTCPECDKEYTLADTMEGKSVKCKGCGNPFTVEAASNGIAAKPSNGRAKAASTATTKAAKPAVKKNLDEDDNEDTDEEPKKSGMGKWLLIGGGLVAVLMLFVCGGVGVGGYFIYRSYNTPPDSSTASNTSKTDSDKDKDKAAKEKADKDKADKDKADKDKADREKADREKPPPPPPAKKFTLADYQQVKGGMTIAQVEGILGAPFTKFDTGDKKTILASWTDGANAINITYENTKVVTWAASFGGKIYGPNTWTDGPATNPGASTITLDNWNKIKGGEFGTEITRLLGVNPQGDAKVDQQLAQFVSDKGTSFHWDSPNGKDFIRVAFNPDGKAAAWTASINSAFYGPKSNDAYVVKPTTTPTNKVTKANFDMLKGGLSEFDVSRILGTPTNGNATLDAGAKPFVGDKGKAQTWTTGNDTITVCYYNGKSALWYATIGGQMYTPAADPKFVFNQSKLNRTLYDAIGVNNTNVNGILQTLGPPTNFGNNGKNPLKDPNYRNKYTWVDGNREIYLESNVQGVVTHKSEKNIGN